MSIQNSYLPQSDISKSESIFIQAPIEVVFSIIEELDFCSSRVIRWLFRLRGLPVPESLTLRGLEKLNFIRLETIKNEEMIIGLIGQFWTPGGRLKKFQPAEFIEFHDAQYAKATWSFSLIPRGESIELTTETRVLCPSPKTKKKFMMYWSVIQPFSTWIRREVLRVIKTQAEEFVKD